MSQEPTPYDAAIADLENRIQYFQTMLDGMKQLRSQIAGAPLPTPVSATRSPNDAEILHDSFFGMTIGDAASKYLKMAKATKSTGDIAAALERGGLKHSSKDFNTTVRSVLGGREDFIRVNGDWGLTEWYPAMRREKRAKQKAEEKASVPPAQTADPEVPNGINPKKKPNGLNIAPGSLKDKLLKLIASEPTRIYKVTELAEKIAAGVPSTQAALSELFKAGLVDRPENGRYTATRAAA